jgi:hypothetical protein
MNKNKRKRLQFGVVALLSIGLVFAVIVHEIVHEGNQRKLLFPFLQKQKAFELTTGLSYEGEKIYFFEWGSDWDADSWYYIVAEIPRTKLDTILRIKSAVASPFDSKSFGWWRFPGIKKPKNPEYYTIDFSRKGRLHIWYDPEDQMLYLMDEWI